MKTNPLSTYRENEFRHMIRFVVLIALVSAGSLSVGASREARGGSRNSLALQVPATEADVRAAVEAVARDTVIHGTYSFDKDRTLTGAKAADSSSFFGQWSGPGKAFYKIADGVLSPVGFKESADIGTIAVRYVVQAVDASNTTVRIDAVFVESAHRAVHPSEGGVESAEYGAFREQLEKIDAERRKAQPEVQRVAKEKADAFTTREASSREASSREALSHETLGREALGKAAGASVSSQSAQELERQVATLRQMVQTRVRAPGTLLKAAPYKSAATLASLPLHTDVVVLILTRYWYGVETADGHRGWVHREQVEALP